MHPVKSVIINRKGRSVMGVSEADGYYGAITDNFEEDFVLFCKRYIRESYLCWDIGSNIGVTSMIMSDFCRNGKILAVDGGEELTRIHKRNVEANSIDNVEPLHFVVNDVGGFIGFSENSAYGGISSESSNKVQAVSPSDLVKIGNGMPDFVKIDCEGHDHMILKAGLEIFKKAGTLVQFEFNSWLMLAHRLVQPLDVLEWVVANFEHVYVRSPGQSELEPLSSIGTVQMLWRNMTQQPYTFLDDIIVTSDTGRMNAS